jgi:hypothetical protein
MISSIKAGGLPNSGQCANEYSQNTASCEVIGRYGIINSLEDGKYQEKFFLV